MVDSRDFMLYAILQTGPVISVLTGKVKVTVVTSLTLIMVVMWWLL